MNLLIECTFVFAAASVHVPVFRVPADNAWIARKQQLIDNPFFVIKRPCPVEVHH